ncbi:MAG: hypothetical protein H6897_07380 [Rhodobacteraceae bacterium]|jgi:hypothetical protein|uniref:hypothetical protein n=1 Tax=Albidovulum sp. TaxID=1872424 RepID=UPI001D407076|nr:hypothetical protein [uncultured Defluviimonas sp.]MCB2125909.1 hypothetical protein [Paracoccaceae bacterium]MCC0069737.1 hypothetical protein [Paracoccaceae bacterium]
MAGNPGGVARNLGTACLLAAAGLTAAAPASRAQEELVVEILWQACPFLLGTAANVALMKLQLPPEEVSTVADIACNVAQAYQAVAASPPAAPAPDSRTAEEIFCEDSYLDYCAGVPGAAPMSVAQRCWMNGLTVTQCAEAVIRSEASRR